jgi:hypothetical protein
MSTQPRFGRRLGREVALVIDLELTAIFALWFALFSPSHRPVIDPAAQIYGAVSTLQR